MTDAPTVPETVADLVSMLETNGGTLVVEDPDGYSRAAWRRVIWAALNLPGLPEGKRLRHSGRNKGDLVVRLVDDTPENAPVSGPRAPVVPVPARTPNRLHPMLRATMQALPEADSGWVRTRRLEGVMHMEVTTRQLPRVWRTLHALFTEAERRGYEIGPGGTDTGKSCGMGVVIDGVPIELSVWEITERIEPVRTAAEVAQYEKYHYWPYREPKFRATGRLRISAWHSKPNSLATDGTRFKIEDRVGRVPSNASKRKLSSDAKRSVVPRNGVVSTSLSKRHDWNGSLPSGSSRTVSMFSWTEYVVIARQTTFVHIWTPPLVLGPSR